jgi:hypothetical protein
MEAGTMLQYLGHGGGAKAGRGRGEQFAQRLRAREGALLLEQEDQRGRDLLHNRAAVEGGRAVGSAPIARAQAAEAGAQAARARLLHQHGALEA